VPGTGEGVETTWSADGTMTGVTNSGAMDSGTWEARDGRLCRTWSRWASGKTECWTIVHLNGDREHRLPNCLNLSFNFVEGESLLMGIHDIAVSSGSACTSASLEPSHVLRAMDVGDDLAHSSIRFGIGRLTTKEEVDFTADKVIENVRRLREMSPLYEMVQEGIDLSTVQWQAEH